MNVWRSLTQFNDRVTYPWQAAAKGLTIQMIDDGFYPAGAATNRTGDGLDSNVLVAPVLWVCRNFTEAHACVQSRTSQIWREVENHPVELLMDKPNDFYGGDELWQATVMSFVMHGEAFWLKVRNPFGEVVELWYIPNFLIDPRYPLDGSQFISHYEYRPSGQLVRLPPRDVVHFRMALDPRDTRRGFSPLRSLLREIATDDEASAFSAHILANMGVPGLLVSPKNDAIRPSAEDVEKLKTYLATAFSGANRGKPMVMALPTEVAQFGMDPSKLMVPDLRDVSEERVCAMLGIPAAVVGFGSGNQSTKVGATMRELRRLAFVNCLAPNQNLMAKQLTRQLLPDFVSQTRRFRVVFDQSGVGAFAEDETLKSERVCRQVQAGLLRVDRGQEALGLEVDSSQRVYLRPSNSMPVGPDAKPADVPQGAVAPDPSAQLNPADARTVDQGKLLAAIAERVTLGHTNGSSHNGDLAA